VGARFSNHNSRPTCNGGLRGQETSPQIALVGEIPAVASFMHGHETALRNLRNAMVSLPSPTELADLINDAAELNSQLEALSTDPNAVAALQYSRQIQALIRQLT
jgi:hypothetical protein